MEAGNAEPEQRFSPEKGNEGDSCADSHSGAGGQRGCPDPPVKNAKEQKFQRGA